jgi:hypothetical protein
LVFTGGQARATVRSSRLQLATPASGFSLTGFSIDTSRIIY